MATNTDTTVRTNHRAEDVVLHGEQDLRGAAPWRLRLLTPPVLAVASALAAFAAPAAAQVPVIPVPVSVASIDLMRERYIWSTLGVKGVLHAAVFGSYDQWRDHPTGWDKSAGSLAKRVGASYVRSAASDGTKFAIARSLHQDPGFVACECRGVARRALHAVSAPFTARDRGGDTVASPAIVSGILAGHLVAAGTWYPAPFSSTAVLSRTGVSVLTKMGMDLFREFRPKRARGV